MSSANPVRVTTVPATKVRESSLSGARRTALIFRVIVALIGCVFSLFPLAYVFGGSINAVNSLTEVIPQKISFDNYTKLVTDTQYPILLWLFNSLKVATLSTIIIVVLTAMAAYAFSRLRFRGRRTGLLAILVVQVFPNTLAITALYLILLQVGNVIPWLGLDSHGGLILIYTGGALGVNTWLMKGFYDTIPRELDESAGMDGATQTQTFFLILLPLIRPVLAVIAILVFIGTYADFLVAKVILTSSENYTLAVGLNLLIDQQQSKNWGQFAAAAIIGAAPIVIVFLVLQKQLVGGLTSGSVKG